MARVSNPDQPIVPTGVILSESEAERLVKEGKAQMPFRHTPFQRRVLLRQEKEIFLGGGRFGGKSAAARAFLLKGNPDLPDYDHNGQPTLVNMSYVYHPNYHATIVRRNRLDLEDFIQKFAQMCRPYGGEWKSGAFRFPSGAWIDAGHMEDRDSWMKYIGVENVRFVFEEAILIPELTLYLQVLLSCRSIYPELRPQVLLTSNAIGPGYDWIMDRFIEAKDADGNIIPPETTIVEDLENPWTHERVRTTRVWLHSTANDNPYAAHDPSYIATLASITDDKMRRAYLLGDWHAMQGIYFDIFRPRGPLPGEPPEASHVIHPPFPKVEPWWHRLISVDWGFAHESAVLWGCRNPNTSQLYVYRELVAPRISPEQLGYEIALQTVEDLREMPDHSLNLFLSHDAFANKQGDKTIAELIVLGMRRVLGPNMVHAPDAEIKRMRELYEESEGDASRNEGMQRAFEEVRTRQRMGITIRVAMKTGPIGWQYCRESLRFTAIGPPPTEFNPQLAQFIHQEHGLERYLQYVKLIQSQRRETLPKLLIWDCCPRLIAAIPKAIHEEGTENVAKEHYTGKDVLDSWLYLMCGYRDEAVPEPYESFRDRRLEEVARQNPNYTASDLRWVQDWTQKEWKERRGGAPIPYIRRSRMLRASTTGVGETRLLPPVVLS